MNAQPDVMEMIRASMVHTVPFAKHTGIELTKVEAGYAEARMKPSLKVFNHMRSIHTGALFTLAETAAGGAVAGGFAKYMMGMKAFPTTLSIELLAPARGVLTASSRISQDIRELLDQLENDGFVSYDLMSEICDENCELVGKLMSSWTTKLRT
jgi:uncharacterized protein (TIGR00369 family)